MTPDSNLPENLSRSKHQSKRNMTKRGGKRDGAGRPENSGIYKEKSKPVRIAERSAKIIQSLNESQRERLADPLHEFLEAFNSEEFGFRKLQNRPSLPLKKHTIRFPSSVAATFDVSSTSEQDNPGEPVDLHEMLVKHPLDSFVIAVSGDSMNLAGINDGDLLVVEKVEDKWTLKKDPVVVAIIDGNQTVKRYTKIRGEEFLMPESDNPTHQALRLSETTDFAIIGIVLYTIRAVNGPKLH